MADNVFGEILEQGGSVVKQTVKQTASLPGQIASDAVRTVLGKSDNSNQDFTEGLLGKPISKQKAQDLKLRDDQKKQQNLSAVRSNLKSLMTPKPKPQTAPPAYVSGKAGFSVEKIQKMQKLQEEQKKKPPPLPKSAQQGQGSGEIGKFVAG